MGRLSERLEVAWLAGVGGVYGQWERRGDEAKWVKLFMATGSARSLGCGSARRWPDRSTLINNPHHGARARGPSHTLWCPAALTRLLWTSSYSMPSHSLFVRRWAAQETVPLARSAVLLRLFLATDFITIARVGHQLSQRRARLASSRRRWRRRGAGLTSSGARHEAVCMMGRLGEAFRHSKTPRE